MHALNSRTKRQGGALDESKIEQVICNFIYNAINYSSPSSLIRVVQEVNGDVVRISVIDEGIGIKEEDLKVIWERELLTKLFKSFNILRYIWINL